MGIFKCVLVAISMAQFCSAFRCESSEQERQSVPVLARTSNVFNRRSGGVGRWSRIGGLNRDDVKDVHFYLFSNPSNPEQLQEVTMNEQEVRQLSWNSSVQTKFIVHGFIQNLNATFPQNVKNAYLKRMKQTGENWNIVVVDWGRLAYQVQDGIPIYSKAVRNVEKVGVRIGEVVKFLIDQNLIEGLQNLHLIGQSLGAHVVGQAGNWLTTQYNGKRVKRITGLDPAGPQFYSKHVGRQLETDDGDFMDIYHCNPGYLGIGVLSSLSLGTVKFYPNYRQLTSIQPQCLFNPHEPPTLCSHNYCPKFFALSILKTIKATKCNQIGFERLFDCTNETAIYGEDVSFQATGKFFVEIPDNLDNIELFMP